jgi:hypothetical protein
MRARPLRRFPPRRSSFAGKFEDTTIAAKPYTLNPLAFAMCILLRLNPFSFSRRMFLQPLGIIDLVANQVPMRPCAPQLLVS